MSADPSVYAAVDHFFAGLASAGVVDVVVSPGLRSTPLTLAANRRQELTLTVVLDERSAAFTALGIAKASNRPVGLICTSGTAGANYYPAVIEASLTRVPLVMITADRPPELGGWDAGQTIDQIEMFGSYVRDFVQMPVAGIEARWAERAAFRAATTAVSVPGGPVHVNWPFREPLEPPSGWVDQSPTSRRIVGAPQTLGIRDGWIQEIAELALRRRGMIVAGPRLAARERQGISEFADRVGWPIVADPLSGLRSSQVPAALANADHLLAAPAFADAMVPDVVLRVGDSPTSKSYRTWVERTQPGHVVLIDPDQRWADAAAVFTARIPAPPGGLLRRAAAVIERAEDRRWLEAWHTADRQAAALIDEVLGSGPFCEGGATRAVLGVLEAGDPLYVASSMPVRDLDMFMTLGPAPPEIYANRGANGIDGTISSATGVAMATRRRTTLLIGDLAFVHDLGGLVTAARLGVDLTIVVLDNRGGGIFSLLPIADAAPSFERLYGTPHEVSFSAAAATVGCNHTLAASAEDLAAVVKSATGVTVVEVPIDRDANVGQIREIQARIGDALSAS